MRAGTWLLALLSCSGACGAIILPHTYTVGPSPCDYPTIQAAINAASATAGDTIKLDATRSYSGQHVTIADKSLTISPGAACTIGGASPAATASTQATISGNSGAASAVLTITGASNVNLADLIISGNTSSGSGGGIQYVGTGVLTLTNVLVAGNIANKCGGIDFEGSDTTPANASFNFVLGSNTQIKNNSAQTDGGGLCVSGAYTVMTMVASGNLVESNSAPNGVGGGIAVFGAEALLDAPDASDAPMIHSNTAKNGGGIAIISTAKSGYSPYVYLGTSGAYPVRVEGNRATDANGGGGAVYMLPNNINSNYLYTNATRIEGNFAIEGSGIYGGCPSTSTCLPAQVVFQRTPCQTIDCNTISSNIAENAAHQPTLGSAVFMQYSAFLASGIRMRGNVGAHVMRTANQTLVSLSDCLVAENVLAAEPIIMATSFSLSIDQCTLANDTIGEPPVIYTDAVTVSITNSVFGEAAATLLASGSVTAQKIVAANTGGLPASVSIVQADPLFFDVANSDYRLRVQTDGINVMASPAVDFAPATMGNDVSDIDGRPRDVDEPSVPDKFGPRDLGAYEMLPITDRVFASGFGDPYMLVN